MEPKTMLKIIFYGVFLVLILLSSPQIIDVVVDRMRVVEEVDPPQTNEYTIKNSNINFFQRHITDNFVANEYNDLRRIIFTVLNSGTQRFTFYCGLEYENCFADLDRITEDQRALTFFNNFVHPFNSYHRLNLRYDDQGKINLQITRLYSPEEIVLLNNKTEKIWDEHIRDSMSQREKIKVLHNAILNMSDYDREHADAIADFDETYVPTHRSHKATGPLLEGYAICGGYSDAMSIFLHKMGIPNYRISNDTHIWNFLYLEDQWLHLDLTWNNPSVDEDTSIIIETYFLITSKELREIDDRAHYYDSTIFAEGQ